MPNHLSVKFARFLVAGFMAQRLNSTARNSLFKNKNKFKIS
jgi:hypothetical protein